MRGAIHNIVIQKLGVAAPDDEGRGGAVVTGTITVRGRVMVKTGKESMAVGRFREDINAVAAVPADTDAASSDSVVISGVSPALDNTYEVMYVFYTEPIMELYLRIRGQ